MRFNLQMLLDGCVQALVALSAARIRDLAAGASEPRAERQRIFEPSAPREPGSDWDLVSETLEDSATRGDAIARLHAAASIEIEAAEYAYLRLIEECPGVYVRDAAQRLRVARAAMEGNEIKGSHDASMDSEHAGPPDRVTRTEKRRARARA